MKITTKGQVTIPIEIRTEIGLLPDTEVEFVVSGQEVILRKSPQRKYRGHKLVATLKGRASKKLSTDQIMALTRGE